MKRWIALLICVVLILSGCAGGAVSQKETEPSQTETPNTTEPTQTTGETDEPTVDTTNPSNDSAGFVDPQLETIVLDGKVRVMGKMLFTPLPGMTAGRYNEYLGHGGGVRLYNTQGKMYGNAVRFLNMKGKAIFEDGQLVGMGPIDNHAGFVSDFVSVESGAPCIVAEYAVDVYNEEEMLYVGVHKYWYALWAVEDKETVYGIWLDQDGYTKDDLIELAQSVTFTKDAFVDEY